MRNSKVLRRKHILFVFRSFEIGGAEKQMALLVDHLQRLDCRCEVFAFQPTGRLRQGFLHKGVTIHDGGLNIEALKRVPWPLVRSMWRLMRTIRKTKPDIVQAALPLWTFIGALAGCIGRVPLIITCRRALGTHQDRHPLLAPLDRMANSLSHRITVNSRAVRDDTIRRDRVDESKLVLIHNAVDPRPYEAAFLTREEIRRDLGLSPREKTVITVANLIPYKGHFDLIVAGKRVIDRIGDVTFLLVGEDRGIQTQLEDEMRALGVTEKIRFLGQRHDIPQLMAASDMSVLPSHEEGFSNVVLESMAAGLPVIATYVGGNPEAILDEVTGWLVPPRNPDLLAEKIIDLINDPEKALKWGQAGREHVRNSFSEQTMVEKHLMLYGEGVQKGYNDQD